MLIPIIDLANLNDETFVQALELAWQSLAPADRDRAERVSFELGFMLGVRTMVHSYDQARKLDGK